MDKRLARTTRESEIVDDCTDRDSMDNLVGFFELLIEIDREQKFNKPSNEVQNNRNPNITN